MHKSPKTPFSGKKLIKRDKKFLAYIGDHITQRGFAPSMRQIKSRFKFRSLSHVKYRLAVIEKHGYLSRTPKVARSLVLTQEGRAWLGLPLAN